MNGLNNNRILVRDISTGYRLLLVVVWIQKTVLTFAPVFLRQIPLVGLSADYILPLLISVSIVSSLPWIIRKTKFSDVIFYLICLIIIFGTVVYSETNAQYIKLHLWRILVTAIPMYFIGIAYDHSIVKKDLFYCSVGSIAIILLYQVYQLASGAVLHSDNMDMAYKVLPSVLYLIYFAFDQKKLMFWVIALTAVITQFIFGTRGPILIVIVYVLFMTYFKMVNKRSVLTFLLWSLGIIIVFLLLNSSIIDSLAIRLSQIFGEIGFSTRIFDFFIEGDIAYTSGRDVLAGRVMQAIWENPIMGYGLMGDRTVIGGYAHNLFLEIWCSFGIVLGTLILIVVFTIPIIAMRRSHGTDVFYIVLLFSSLAFIKLMLSGSYITEQYFFLMIGLSVGTIRKMNRRYNRFKKND